MPTPLQTLRAEVTTVNNQTKAGQSDVVLVTSGGYLRDVTPIIPSGAAVPRGRLYVECYVVDASGDPVGVAWRGYFVAANNRKVGGPSSTPNMFLSFGMGLRAVATQTGRGSPVTIQFVGSLSEDAPAAGGYVHAEEPGSGQGEAVSDAMANPAAGANFATATIPDATRYKLRSVGMKITTDATAANRRINIQLSDPTTADLRVTAGVDITASRVHVLGWGVGSAHDTVLPASGLGINVSLPDTPARSAGDRIVFATTGIQVGDQFEDGRRSGEEWAVPA